MASAGQTQITASRGVKIVADTTLGGCAGRVFDLIAVPGGMPGAQTLARSRVLADLLERQMQAGRWVAAICAAPVVVLQAHGHLKGLKATCHPALYAQMDPALLCREPVVVDRNVVTAQGPGAAIEFALTLVEHLVGQDKRREVAVAMVVPEA